MCSWYRPFQLLCYTHQEQVVEQDMCSGWLSGQTWLPAQLVFIVGVERTENEVKSVTPFTDHPLSCTLQAVCSAIAVLLHYLFTGGVHVAC